jgi:hypothetical protein
VEIKWRRKKKNLGTKIRVRRFKFTPDFRGPTFICLLLRERFVVYKKWQNLVGKKSVVILHIPARKESLSCLVKHHSIKIDRRRGGMTSLILKLGTRFSSFVSFNLQPFYPHTRASFIIKVQQYRNRPRVAQRVPGGLGSQIFMTFCT